jgi:curved DNA-binding protein CbpA
MSAPACFRTDRMATFRSTEGSLSKTPIAQVMAYIFRKNLSGTLVLKDGGSNEYRIVFIKGMPSHVDGKGMGHPMGEVFVEAGLITKSELEAYVGEARRAKIILGRFLMDNGIIDRRQLETAMRLQIRKRIRDLFSIIDGEFAFHPDENFVDISLEEMVPTSMAAILPESLRATWPDHLLAEKLESIRQHTFSVADYDLCCKSFSWSRAEMSALETLSSKRWSLRKIEHMSGGNLRNFRLVLYTLLLTGYLDFQAGEDEEARKAEEARQKKLKAMHDLMSRKLGQIKKGTHFDVLEVKTGTDTAKIKESYMRLLRDFHPDKVEPLRDEALKEGFEHISREIKAAMDVLADPQARKKYEAELRGEDLTKKEEDAIVKQVLDDEFAFQKALVLLNKKNYHGVVELLQPVIDRGTDNGEYLAAYAWSRLAKGAGGKPAQECMEMLRHAVELAPNSERANFFMALAAEKEENDDEYAQYIRYTLEINPHNIEAKRRMHILRMRKKRSRTTLSNISNKFKGLLSKKR